MLAAPSAAAAQPRTRPLVPDVKYAKDDARLLRGEAELHALVSAGPGNYVVTKRPANAKTHWTKPRQDDVLIPAPDGAGLYNPFFPGSGGRIHTLTESCSARLHTWQAASGWQTRDLPDSGICAGGRGAAVAAEGTVVAADHTVDESCGCSEMTFLRIDPGDSGWSDVGRPPNFPNTRTSEIGGYGWTHKTTSSGNALYFIFAFRFDAGDELVIAKYNLATGWSNTWRRDVSRFGVVDAEVMGDSLLVLGSRLNTFEQSVLSIDHVTPSAWDTVEQVGPRAAVLAPLDETSAVVWHESDGVYAPAIRAQVWSATNGWGETRKLGRTDQFPADAALHGGRVYVVYDNARWLRVHAPS